MDDFDIGEYLRAPGINLGISKQYQSRLISRCDRPEKRNSLWTDWITPTLMVDALDMHLPLYPSKEAVFSHEGSKHAYSLTREDMSTQMAYA